MARALLVVHRRGRVGYAAGFEAHLEALNRSLAPDNVVTPLWVISRENGATAVVFNPNGGTRIQCGSILIGPTRGASADWHKPGGASPEGSCALLRSDAGRVELIADAAATRTLWYVLTSDAFIASTSQRAIVALLGRFEPSASAVAWMISSGTLGPEGGWDARLSQVLPNERVVLDRARWRLTREVTPVRFKTVSGWTRAEHGRAFAQIVESACGRYELDPSKWAFLLSGGVDSRGLLSLLPSRNRMQTITWGLGKSPQEAWTDARIAKRAASEFGVRNRFFPTDVADETRERLIQRFLVAGEGRVANISPFLDGFALWASLLDERLDGVVRGDEAFGQRHVRNPYEVRCAAKLTLLGDYFDAREIDALGLTNQTIPATLAQRRDETLATWRDRLYQQHRLPNFLAGLTDLQAAYVEVVNPLLDATILQCVRALPDELRTNKHLWREFVCSKTHVTRLARRPAVLPLVSFLNDTAMLELMLAEMETAPGSDVLSPVLRAGVCATIKAALRTSADRRERAYTPGWLVLLAPDRVRYIVRRYVPVRQTLSPITFAFRAFIVSRMTALLYADSMILPSQRPRIAAL